MSAHQLEDRRMRRADTCAVKAGRARALHRRAFLLGMGLATTKAWPGFAQVRGLAKVGLLGAPAAATYGHHIAAIRHGLSDQGLIENHDFVFESRWADGQYDRLPALAADLVRSGVDVIMTLGGGPPVRAAKVTTTSVPIVFHLGADPVQAGLVASMNRPGGNITGVTLLTNSLETKRLELLRMMVPTAKQFAILANPANPSGASQIDALRAVAPRMHLDLIVLHASREAELADAFAAARQQHADAMTVLPDVFFTSNSALLAALSRSHRMPAIAHSREFTEAGGLMSYGTNLAEAYRLAGAYAGRILKGERPSELPVLEPTRFDFLINLKTAKEFNLSVSPDLMVFATEVIE